MKIISKIRPALRLAALLALAGHAGRAPANPTGLTVSTGTAIAQQIGAQLNLSVSQLAVLNWSSFNIQAGETTSFLQPSANSIVFNIIGGANPSQIFGNLNANGSVILANANGFYFGPNSMIKVGGSFIATTAPLTPDIGTTGPWLFTGMPPLASIVNYGQIEVGQGRSLYLIAENVANHGGLAAPGGDVGLLAGQSVLVSERPDGRGLSATVQVPAGEVDSFGQITADAGTIAMQAKVVNQNGVIQADSVQNQNGVVELIAADELNLGANSQISASGDDSASGSAGGNVTLKSDNTFSDSVGSEIVVTGGAHGGNGGNVEISAPTVESLNSGINARAQSGWTAGTLLLDPDYIILDTSGADSAGSGTVLAGDNPGSTLDLNVNSAFANIAVSQITLQAAYDITLADSTTWDLSGTIGANFGGVTSGQLTLQAGRNIFFGDGALLTDENNWSVTLQAGYDFVNNVVQPGAGSIYLNNNSGDNTGGGWIQTSAGNVNLIAGQDILLGGGSVFTSGGGSVFVDALAGSIDLGSWNGGISRTAAPTRDYLFTSSGAQPNTILGGFSTAAGGDVTLLAGDNVDNTLSVSSSTWPGESGAYGAGDVTVIAGNQITGNYVVANGTGTLLAGVPVSSTQAGQLQNRGTDPADFASALNGLETSVQQAQNSGGNIGAASGASGPVTLSLISGSWNAWAANNIYIKEVNNPNGTFNAAQNFLFNYAPDAVANFWAGNAIELTGNNLHRVLYQNVGGPFYAPVLTLNAGAGGVKIDKSIYLFPSSEGALQIVTRDGGDLSGATSAGTTTLTGITMSDGNPADYTTFANGYSPVPLHLNNPNPVTLDISGDINSFGLTVPTFAQINVTGNTYNFGFLGENLSPAQTTYIHVGGAITFRGDLTSEILSAPISASLFDAIISGDPSLFGKLSYDASTGTLTYVGVLSDDSFLLNPTDASGQPIAFTDSQLASWQTTVAKLSSDSLTASLGDQGLALAGPGTFNVTANNIDLGISGGISVFAPDSALAAISPYGANLNVTTAGDLAMTATSIANQGLLGGINLNIGGALDVGDQFTAFGDPNFPKGIFTTSGGSISVTANGTINVNGSRIAAYDGGNITVASQTGDVNAGTGGSGYVTMNALELDPVTGGLDTIYASVPGSGILATTLPGGNARLGDITVSAPDGSINASLGGIIQLAFNGADSRNNFIQLDAGQDINAYGSGIIGSNIRLQAGGNINGLVVGSQSVDIISAHNVSVTAVSGGNVDISASGTVAGTVIGGGDVSVSGDTIDADVRGGSVSTSGDTSGASLGVPQSNVTKDNTQTADNASATASKTDDQSDDDKKKKKGVALAQKVSRVTVLLPQKN